MTFESHHAYDKALRNYVCCLLLSALGLWLSPALGQSNYGLAHLGTKEGLLSDDAYCILEDRNGFIWIGTAGGLQRFDGDELVDFPIAHEGLADVLVRDIILQGEDTIWIAIRGGGVRSIVKSKVSSTITVENGLSSNLAECLMVDHEGTLWVGTIDAGINAISNGKVLKNHRLSAYRDDVKSRETYALMEDQLGNIWEGTTQGINFYHSEGGYTIFRHSEDNPQSLSHNYAHEFHQDKKGNIWIGTVDGGLNLFNEFDSTFTAYQYNSGVTNQISHNVILAIEQDKTNDGLWIGTWGGGLNYFDGVSFVSVFDRAASSNLKSDRIEDILVDSSGDLWIATYQGGVNKYYQQTFKTYNVQENARKGMLQNTITHINPSSDGGVWLATNEGVNHFQDGTFKTISEASGALKFNDINQILEDREGGLWMGMIGTGRGIQYLQNGHLTHYYHTENDPKSLSSDFIESIFEDEQGSIWIGTRDGLNLFQDGQFIRYKANTGENTIPSNQIRSISGSHGGGLWIATYGGGLSLFKNGHFTNFLDPETMPYKFLWNVVESRDHKFVWITTSGGIVKFDPETQQSRRYTDRDGLISELVDDITIDTNGRIWAASSKGLCLYLPETDKFKTFTSGDGLAGDNVNGLTQQGNLLYVGGENGFSSLNLDQFQVDNPKNALTFTRLEILDAHAEDKPIDSQWETIESNIELAHDQNNFNLYFSSLKLGIDDDPQYAYFIDEINQDWVFNNNSNKISVIDLPPGSYHIQVRELSTPEIAQIQLTINAPFWNTGIARFIYGVTSLFLGLIIISFLRKRKKLREELKRSEYDRQKDNELNGLKLKFFTNVSHELRTPLTLILGPVQDLIDQKVAPAYHDKLMFIRDNSQKLLSLTNQLLDFRKVSMDRMELVARKQDIVPLVKTCFETFQFEADQKNLSYSLKNCPEYHTMYFDPSKLETVLMNLLSNAFKFQQGNVQVELNIDGSSTQEGVFEHNHLIKNYFEIRVSDNGKGLKQAEIPLVFDRFYQANQQDALATSGTGIGLALSKDLIDLHHGELSVESIPNQITSFIIRLPFGAAHLAPEQIVNGLGTEAQEVSNPTAPIPILPQNKQPHTLLLVEDNQDLMAYLSTELSRYYEIITAENGIEGLNVLEKHAPDLIISDVMMEQMDGITFCRQIKSDPETSHVPVILLTARGVDEYERDGLKAGANDYIVKPFNLASLIAKVDNFMQMRKSFKAHYQQTLQEPETSTIPSEEETFISKLITLIQAHLQESTFGVGELASLLNMSQSALYKKTKFLIGKSVVELISEVKLQEAASQIISTDKRISEIAYDLGFNDPKYFRDRFKKTYNLAPSDYRKQHKSSTEIQID